MAEVRVWALQQRPGSAARINPRGVVIDEYAFADSNQAYEILRRYSWKWRLGRVPLHPERGARGAAAVVSHPRGRAMRGSASRAAGLPGDRPRPWFGPAVTQLWRPVPWPLAIPHDCSAQARAAVPGHRGACQDCRSPALIASTGTDGQTRWFGSLVVWTPMRSYCRQVRWEISRMTSAAEAVGRTFSSASRRPSKNENGSGPNRARHST